MSLEYVVQFHPERMSYLSDVELAIENQAQKSRQEEHDKKKHLPHLGDESVVHETAVKAVWPTKTGIEASSASSLAEGSSLIDKRKKGEQSGNNVSFCRMFDPLLSQRDTDLFRDGSNHVDTERAQKKHDDEIQEVVEGENRPEEEITKQVGFLTPQHSTHVTFEEDSLSETNPFDTISSPYLEVGFNIKKKYLIKSSDDCKISELKLAIKSWFEQNYPKFHFVGVSIAMHIFEDFQEYDAEFNGTTSLKGATNSGVGCEIILGFHKIENLSSQINDEIKDILLSFWNDIGYKFKVVCRHNSNGENIPILPFNLPTPFTLLPGSSVNVSDLSFVLGKTLYEVEDKETRIIFPFNIKPEAQFKRARTASETLINKALSALNTDFYSSIVSSTSKEGFSNYLQDSKLKDQINQLIQSAYLALAAQNTNKHRNWQALGLQQSLQDNTLIRMLFERYPFVMDKNDEEGFRRPKELHALIEIIEMLPSQFKKLSTTDKLTNTNTHQESDSLVDKEKLENQINNDNEDSNYLKIIANQLKKLEDGYESLIAIMMEKFKSQIFINALDVIFNYKSSQTSNDIISPLCSNKEEFLEVIISSFNPKALSESDKDTVNIILCDPRKLQTIYYRVLLIAKEIKALELQQENHLEYPQIVINLSNKVLDEAIDAIKNYRDSIKLKNRVAQLFKAEGLKRAENVLALLTHSEHSLSGKIIRLEALLSLGSIKASVGKELVGDISQAIFNYINTKFLFADDRQNNLPTVTAFVRALATLGNIPGNNPGLAPAIYPFQEKRKAAGTAFLKPGKTDNPLLMEARNYQESSNP